MSVLLLSICQRGSVIVTQNEHETCSLTVYLMALDWQYLWWFFYWPNTQRRMEGWCLWITTTALLLHWRCMGVSIWWIWMLFSAAQGRRHHWAGARFVFCLFCSIIRNQDFKASFLFNKPGLPLAYKLTHLTHYYSKPHSLSPSQSMFISVPIAHTDILHLFFFSRKKTLLSLSHTPS